MQIGQRSVKMRGPKWGGLRSREKSLKEVIEGHARQRVQHEQRLGGIKAWWVVLSKRVKG